MRTGWAGYRVKSLYCFGPTYNFTAIFMYTYVSAAFEVLFISLEVVRYGSLSYVVKCLEPLFYLFVLYGQVMLVMIVFELTSSQV